MVNETALTTTESTRKKALIATVKAAIDSIGEGGNALLELRDSRLYRDTHGDFDTFCQDVFGKTKTHINRLIDAAEVARDLTPIGVTPKESHLRELKSVEPAQRDSVFREAVESSPKKNGKPHVTAKHVQKVVAKRKPAPEAAPPEPPKLDPEPWASYNTDAQRVIALMDEFVGLIERMKATPFGHWIDVKGHTGSAKGNKADFEKWQVIGFKPQWEIGKDGRNYWHTWEQKKKGGK
jgi:hypothetical protein